jgi:hypothetical protein
MSRDAPTGWSVLSNQGPGPDSSCWSVTQSPPKPPAASPYATGGGVTVLEHRYGAVLLAHLLTGDPVPGLGTDATPFSVRFQASHFSPVDDLLLVGRTPDDGRRQISIGVRRAPSLIASEGGSARLMGSYVRIVTDHWEEVQAGRWRLGLDVASRTAAVQQVRELSVIAGSTPDEAAFRVEMERPGRTNTGRTGFLFCGARIRVFAGVDDRFQSRLAPS